MAKMTTYERALQIYQVLIALAHLRQTITYQLLGKTIGFPARALARPLGHLAHYCQKNGLPPITVLVVQKNSGKPGPGYPASSDYERDRE